jgi:hypothetical protein
MRGIRSPCLYRCDISTLYDSVVFDLHVIFILEQAEPHSSGWITIYHSDIVIFKVIKHTVNDTHVPTIDDQIMAAIQLIVIKVKGVYHTSIYV